MTRDVLVFLAAAATIGFAATRLARDADRLADRTGLGEALTGTVLLGLVTALPGLTASVAAALAGRPALAIGNALGGIAFQTTILAFADIAHRDANLEHAAASLENVMQTLMLILLVTLVLIGLSGPDVTLGPVHPVTWLLLLTAALAFVLVYRVRNRPMWWPRQTSATVMDRPDPASHARSLPRLIGSLLVMATLSLVAGVYVARSAGAIVAETGLSEALMGGLFMALATSLPELVTCLAAVRRGALTLAVADVVGGNFFDVLFVAAADFAYFGRSIYHGSGVGRREIFVAALTILLNVVLLAGLVYRQRHGPGNIGIESVAMLAIYLAGFFVLAVAM
ncbi:MAG: sodium:calcium antiporter [Myxococcota bacterium]